MDWKRSKTTFKGREWLQNLSLNAIKNHSLTYLLSKFAMHMQ